MSKTQQGSGTTKVPDPYCNPLVYLFTVYRPLDGGLSSPRQFFFVHHLPNTRCGNLPVEYDTFLGPKVSRTQLVGEFALIFLSEKGSGLIHFWVFAAVRVPPIF